VDVAEEPLAVEGILSAPIDKTPRVSTPSPDHEDAELVRRTLSGEVGAFEDLVHRHYRDLLRTLQAMARRVEDAEDAAQEAFLRAYRALDRFDQTRPFRPWLWTIGIRLVLQGLARKERKNVSLETIGTASEGPSLAESGWMADPRSTERLDEQLLHRDLDRALKELSPDHRAILVLAVLEERSYEEIAQILNIPRGTVMSRLSRARARLREKLAGWLPHEEGDREHV
jgi:RNA polymerase sigma-70 factor (ECF subfamily)